MVSGGLAGLCISLLLAQHGVRSLLIERHPGTSIHPRARGLNVRSMELLRTWGLEGAVRAAGRAQENARYIRWATSLAGEELRRVPNPAHRPFIDTSLSPTSYLACGQHYLEPVLLGRARACHAAPFRFSHELLSFRQDEVRVTAVILDRSTCQEMSVGAEYLIASDGATSEVRAALDVLLTDIGTLGQWIGTCFRADLGRFVVDRPSLLYWIHNPEVHGLFVAVNNTDR